MRSCSAFACSPPPPTAETRRWMHVKTSPTIRIGIGEGFRNALLAGALSLGLFLAPPPPPLPAAAECHEEQRLDDAGSITNEGLVVEAWEVVNESFLDAGNHGWSPEGWLQKKDDILSSRIQSRSKAHDIIRRMLASLHDPYTRFLSPPEAKSLQHYSSY